jgi:hypothetical protein
MHGSGELSKKHSPEVAFINTKIPKIYRVVKYFGRSEIDNN